MTKGSPYDSTGAGVGRENPGVICQAPEWLQHPSSNTPTTPSVLIPVPPSVEIARLDRVTLFTIKKFILFFSSFFFSFVGFSLFGFVLSSEFLAKFLRGQRNFSKRKAGGMEGHRNDENAFSLTNYLVYIIINNINI